MSVKPLSKLQKEPTEVDIALLERAANIVNNFENPEIREMKNIEVNVFTKIKNK